MHRMTFDPHGRLPQIAVGHVATLAALLNVQRIQWSTRWRDWAVDGQMMYSFPPGVEAIPENIDAYGCAVGMRDIVITLPKLRSDFAYACALHELGHVAVGAHEAKAWAWAHDVALWWSPLMHRTACLAMAGYAHTRPNEYPEDKILRFLCELTPFNMGASL